MSPKVVGRLMFVLGYVILLSLLSLQVMARELTVFAIQKNLPLKNQDPIYHDVYLDGGTEAGLKAGQIVTVERRLPLHDLIRNRPLGDLHLPVAMLKIIYVEKGSSVARLHKLYSGKDRPVIDFDAVMIGDKVSDKSIDADLELSTGTSESSGTQATPVNKRESPKPSVEKAEAVIPLPEKTAPDVHEIKEAPLNTPTT